MIADWNSTIRLFLKYKAIKHFILNFKELTELTQIFGISQTYIRVWIYISANHNTFLLLDLHYHFNIIIWRLVLQEVKLTV